MLALDLPLGHGAGGACISQNEKAHQGGGCCVHGGLLKRAPIIQTSHLHCMCMWCLATPHHTQGSLREHTGWCIGPCLAHSLAHGAGPVAVRAGML
jgi:hypothetical protein